MIHLATRRYPQKRKRPFPKNCTTGFMWAYYRDCYATPTMSDTCENRLFAIRERMLLNAMAAAYQS